MSDASSHSQGIRRLPVWGLVLVIVVHLGILQGLSIILATDPDLEFAAPTTLNELWRSISVGVVPDKSYPLAGLFILANVVMLVIVLVHRHRISPPATAAT